MVCLPTFPIKINHTYDISAYISQKISTKVCNESLVLIRYKSPVFEWPTFVLSIRLGADHCLLEFVFVRSESAVFGDRILICCLRIQTMAHLFELFEVH